MKYQLTASYNLDEIHFQIFFHFYSKLRKYQIYFKNKMCFTKPRENIHHLLLLIEEKFNYDNSTTISKRILFQNDWR